MRRRMVLAGVAAALATALLMLVPGVSPAASIECGAIVTADTTLTADITGCAGDGIVIGANDITLDLNGHTLSGTRAGFGIDSAGFSGTQVLNGTIEGFAAGIWIACDSFPRCAGTRRNVLQSLHIEQNNGAGIEEIGPTRTLVSNNVIHDNMGSGVDLQQTPGDVLNNQIFNNGGLAIHCHTNSVGVIANNNIHDGGGGIWVSLSGNTIRDNVVRRVSGPGIHTDDLNDSFYSGYVIANNTLESNGSYGIEVVGNEGDPTVEDGGANVANSNGGTPQCIVRMVYANRSASLPCARNRGQVTNQRSAHAPPRNGELLADPAEST